jgi:hypothetical protein
MRLALAGALVVLAGCTGGLRPYPEDATPKNLTVQTKTSGVRAELDIHSVDAQCRAPYVGTVKLNKPSVAVGIPADGWSYLKFDFASSSLLRGSHQMSKATLLRTRAGYSYEAEVTYKHDIYNVVLREKPPRGATREIALLDLASCQK